MEERRYLFLCHQGSRRSPAAARVAREMAKEGNLKIEMDYGAADALDERNAGYMVKHLARYEKIIVMQEDIRNKLESIGVERAKVYCLDIEDDSSRSEEELQELLRTRFSALGLFLLNETLPTLTPNTTKKLINTKLLI